MAGKVTIVGQAVIPGDWLGEYCCYSVLWPVSEEWLAVLRGLLTLPAQGRYWDANTGNIVGAQSVILDTFDNNLHLTEVLMSCTDDVATALQAIATALANQGGCSDVTVVGGGGAVDVSCYANSNAGIQDYITLTDGTIWPIFGSQPIAELPESGYPEGYPNVEDYDTDKCRKATKIVDDFVDSLNNLGNISWGTGAIGVVAVLAAIVGLITVPPVAIPLLLFALTANVGITALVIELSNEVEANREDLICLLYEGENVQFILNSVSDFFDVIIAAIAPAAALGIALKSIAMWLMSGDTLNFLFSASAANLYPNADCSCASCENPEEHTWDFTLDSDGWVWSCEGGSCSPGHGWYDPFNAVYITIESAYPTARQRWISPEGCYAGNTFQVTLSAQSNATNLVGRGIVHYVDDTEDVEDLVASGTWPSSGTNYDMDVQDKEVLWVAVEWEYSGLGGGLNFNSFFNQPVIYFQV